MYINIKRLRDLKLDESTSIGYTFKCMGSGFWVLKKDDFRTALQKIVLEVKDIFLALQFMQTLV